MFKPFSQFCTLIDAFIAMKDIAKGGKNQFFLGGGDSLDSLTIGHS